MKKRLLSLVLCLVMVFSLFPSFANAQVYPVGEESTAVEIQFYKNADDAADPEKEPISTQRVNNNGGAVPAGAIYDPGCPLDEQETFVDWTWNSGHGSVQDLLTYVNANYDRLKGKTLVVTAETSHVWYLVYHDEDGRVLRTEAVASSAGSTTVEQEYVPNDPRQKLVAWNTEDDGTGATYINDQEIAVTANTDLYPVCESGFWLLFDSYIAQDDDKTTSTFTAPEFYQATEDTEKPDNPERTGYRFDGWFTDTDFTNDFTFGGKLTEDTTLYAKWTAVETTYTVVFWQQKATDAVDAADADKTYDYYASDVRPATTGASASIKDADKQLSSTGLSTEVPAMGFYFTYNDANSDTVSAVVKGDGSTVLNVYYDRKPITFSFYRDVYQAVSGQPNLQSGTPVYYIYYNDEYCPVRYYSAQYTYAYSKATDNSGTQYAVIDGVWTELDYDSAESGEYFWWYQNSEGKWIRWDGVRYKYLGYYSPSNASFTYYKIVPELVESETGLYGAPFTDWPELTDEVWNSDGSIYPLPLTQFVPASNHSTTLTEQIFTASAYTGNYGLYVYGQNLEGTYSPHYVISDTSTWDGGQWFPTETFEGFTVEGYNTTDDPSSMTPVTSDGETEEGMGTLYLYYKRNQHSFTMQSANNPAWKTENLYYGKSLSEYASLVPDNGSDGYYFDGWYADPECTQRFDFDTTMPDNNVTVYAKWTLMRFRVVVDPRGGVDTIPTTDIHFDAVTQKTTFRVNYGEQIKEGGLKSATRKGNYQLVGWYYKDENNKEHDFNFAYAEWDEIADMAYKNATPAERQGTDPWNGGEAYNDADGLNKDVVGKVTIYARWRQKLASNESLCVLYDAANGKIGENQTYLDPMLYADTAEVIAQPASVSNVPGEQFSVWEVMKPTSETDPTLVPTGVEVRPGDTFKIHLENAVEATQGENTVYTVTLRAKYVSNPTTHITWVANDGNEANYVNSSDANLNAESEIKPADTFTRDGYVFLGWARATEDGNNLNGQGTQWAQHPEYTASDLWLIWNEDTGKFYVNHEKDKTLSETEDLEAKKVSADNRTPFHVLYAVWEKTTPATYLIDFGAQMKLAENGSIKKGTATEKNGKFSIVDGAAVYQLLANKEDKTIAGGADLTMSGVDSATIRGNFYVKDSETGAMVTEAKAAWKDVTVVPASSVYFDDSFTAPITVGDGSGYNAQITSATSVTGDSDKLDGTYTVQFHGSRIDVYCTTDATSLAVTARVKNNATQQYVKNLLVSNKFQDENINVLYNVPTISVDCGAVGDYTLELTVKDTANYRFDGIRIYDPVDNGNYTGEAASEANATFLKVRDQLLPSATITAINDYFKAKKAYDEAEDHTGMTEPQIPQSIQNVQGVMFYMDKGASTVADDDPLKNMKVAAEYGNYGPKNEIYLKQGEGLSFSIQNGPTENMKAWIGLSAPQGLATGNNVIVTVNGTTITPAPALTAVDMYYLLDGAQNGQTITIQNDGPNLISVTNVKITGSTKGNNPGLDASVLSVADAETAASVLSVDDGLPYLAVTAQEVKTLNAPAQAEDPQPTADPEPTPTADPEPTPTQPSIAEWISNLFSSFVNALFGSIARLFGN